MYSQDWELLTPGSQQGQLKVSWSKQAHYFQKGRHEGNAEDEERKTNWVGKPSIIAPEEPGWSACILQVVLGVLLRLGLKTKSPETHTLSSASKRRSCFCHVEPPSKKHQKPSLDSHFVNSDQELRFFSDNFCLGQMGSHRGEWSQLSRGLLTSK